MPPSLLQAVSHEKLLADRGTARIEQHAFADFLTRGELDRHLRRMRTRYRSRRDALVDALTEALPEAAVRGVAAGLHVTVQLPDGVNEQAIREEAQHRRVELETMADYRPDTRGRPPVLLLGYAQMPESAIRAGVHELAKAVRAAKTHWSTPAAPERGGGPGAGSECLGESVGVGSPQTLSEADRRIVAGWAADCAHRVLWLFEAKAPGDSRPRDAIARTRAFARGELDVAEEIRRRFVGGSAAREVATPSAAAAAKAAGQAAAIPHMGAHALGAAAYAAKAAGLAAPDRPEAVTDEIRWQLSHCWWRPELHSGSSRLSVRTGPDRWGQDCSRRACLARSSAISRPAWRASNADVRLRTRRIARILAQTALQLSHLRPQRHHLALSSESITPACSTTNAANCSYEGRSRDT